MPRGARIRAESGIYHIILRGINHQQIFEDKEDYRMFLNLLLKYKQECGYRIFAYCLMGNHIHLLMQEREMPLGQIFRHIGTSFVYWYNGKYQRTGHLFQDRFKSEVVENEEYFYTVINYIHQNPVKAGLCKRPEEYRYSSFREFLGNSYLIDMDFLVKFISRKTVVEMGGTKTSEECLEVNERRSRQFTDDRAKYIIWEITGYESPNVLQTLQKIERDKYIRALKERGLPIRQLSRLTGISYSVIQRA